MANEKIDPYEVAGTGAVKPAATSATSSTPYGYSQTQADAIVTWIRLTHDALVEKGILSE